MKQNRGYKKELPFRDCSLIVIACEGEKRELQYFSFFEKIHPRRCKVVILKDEEDEGRSAPHWVLERVKKYHESNQIGPEDFLFLVLDVDNWKRDIIYAVDAFCQDQQNHLLIVSNPCFEVWLYYHIGDPSEVVAKTCKDWKQLLHEKTKAGFQIDDYPTSITGALSRAKNQDKDPSHFFPAENHSKAYLIIEKIIEKIGKVNFDAYIEQFRQD